MASSKDIYESHVHAASIYAAGVFRGTGAAAVETADVYYPLRCAEGLNIEVRGAEGLNIDLRGDQ